MEINIKNEDKILIVSPHQDDESIGCGGLLALYGPQCDVLLLTDGRLGNIESYKDYEKLIEIRNSELDSATSIAKVNEVYRLNIEDSTLKDNKTKVKSFDIKKYDYIFVPNRYETHCDHKCVLSIFKSMIKKQNAKAKLFEYEVWTPLRNPTWHLNIEEVINVKKKMIEQYKSQIEDRDYVSAALGLNSYRGLASQYKYAEAYTDANYSDIAGKIYEASPEFIKELARKAVSK